MVFLLPKIDISPIYGPKPLSTFCRHGRYLARLILLNGSTVSSRPTLGSPEDRYLSTGPTLGSAETSNQSMTSEDASKTLQHAFKTPARASETPP